MERVIYCPDESLIDEAGVISKIHKLPILVGENDKTKLLDFERSTVQVLQIPSRKELIISNNEISLGFHQVVIYINEFFELKNNIKLFINNIEISPLYEEKFKVKYLIECTTIGKYFGKITINNEQIEEFNFVVN